MLSSYAPSSSVNDKDWGGEGIVEKALYKAKEKKFKGGNF